MVVKILYLHREMYRKGAQAKYPDSRGKWTEW